MESHRSPAVRLRRARDTQHIALPQWSAFEAAEAAQDVRRGAAEERLYGDAALHAQVAPRSRARGAKAKRLAGARFQRRPRINGNIIKCRTKVRAGEREDGALGKQECAAKQSHLKSRCAFRVSDQAVSQAQRNGIGGS